MDFLTNLLSSVEVQDAIISVLGIFLTFIISRAAAAFTMATGLQIEAKHREVLHEAIITAVESGMKLGPEVGMETLRAHVFHHLRQSVPQALTALTPGDGVLDRLIERYAREALAKFGEPK
jgi:hypothetical protein